MAAPNPASVLDRLSAETSHLRALLVTGLVLTSALALSAGARPVRHAESGPVSVESRRVPEEASPRLPCEVGPLEQGCPRGPRFEGSPP